MTTTVFIANRARIERMKCVATGGPKLVDMMDIHEMMYDPESGCMLVQVDSYMLLEDGAATMRMRHVQWLYRPVVAEDLTGCEVRSFDASFLMRKIRNFWHAWMKIRMLMGSSSCYRDTACSLCHACLH